MQASYTTGPFILFLETATEVSSVAVYQGDTLKGLYELRTDKLHARLLTVMVERLMQDLDLKMDQLSAVGFSSGPGSYTGLRVGVSVAKGLCFALDIPLMAVHSVMALGASVADLAAGMGAMICPMIDARRMEVYTAVYTPGLETLHPVSAMTLDEHAFAAFLSQGRVLFLGDGAAKFKGICTNPNAIFLESRTSTAGGQGALLAKKFKMNEFEDVVHFEPYYLKDFVATTSKKKLI